MIEFKGTLYMLSNEIIYKRSCGAYGSEKPEYIIYLNNQCFVIRGVSAKVFTYLIDLDQYSFNQNTVISVEKEEYLDDSEIKDINIAMEALIEQRWAVLSDVISPKELIKSKGTILINEKEKYFILNLAYRTVDEISEKIYNKFSSEDYLNFTADECNYLIGRRYLTYVSDNGVQRLIVKNNSINIYVIFSYECNMNCTYCFEHNETQYGRGTSLSIDTLLSSIAKLEHSEKIIVTLYGGEPLLGENRDKIITLIEWAKNRENIYFRIITNGINIDSYMGVFSKIKKRITEFVITVDGMKDIHDKRRVFKDGTGTFNQITKSIELLCENGFSVSIRVNLDKDNIHHQVDFLNYLSGLKLNKDLISVTFHRVEDKGNLPYTSVTYKDCYELYKRLISISDIKIYFREPVITTIIEMLSSKEAYPYVRADYCNIDNNYIIDYDNNAYSCTEAMGISEFKRNLEKDEVLVSNLITDKCKECSYYYICYGGCYLNKYLIRRDIGHEMCEKSDFVDVIKEFCMDYAALEKETF